MGTYRLDQQQNACDLWVRGSHPAGLDTPCTDSYLRPPFVSWRDYEEEDSDSVRSMISGMAEPRSRRDKTSRSKRR